MRGSPACTLEGLRMEVSVWTEDDSLQWLEQWRLAQRRPALSRLEPSSRRWSCLERSWLEWPWRGRGWSNSGWSGRGASDQSWHTSVWIGRLYREPQPEDIRWIASEVLGFEGPNEAVRYSIASWSPSLALGLSVHLSTSERAARRQAMLDAKGKQIRCRCEHSTGAGHFNIACAQTLCVHCRGCLICPRNLDPDLHCGCIPLAPHCAHFRDR